jgi:hypothetical protein
VFEKASGVTVSAQLLRNKGDGHYEVEVVVTGIPPKNIVEASSMFHSPFTGLPSSTSDFGAIRVTQPSDYSTVTLPSSVAPIGPASGMTSSGSLLGVIPSDGLAGLIIGADQFGTVLQRMIAAVPTGFLFYGANSALIGGSTWTPAANLPDSLECGGSTTPEPLIRCTMFRSPDLTVAERRLMEIVVKVQAALPGSDWTKDESSNEALADHGADWWQRKVVFKSSTGAILEAQLWKSKKDGHLDVDVVVTRMKR